MGVNSGDAFGERRSSRVPMGSGDKRVWLELKKAGKERRNGELAIAEESEIWYDKAKVTSIRRRHI